MQTGEKNLWGKDKGELMAKFGDELVRFGKHTGKRIGDLTNQQLGWLSHKAHSYDFKMRVRRFVEFRNALAASESSTKKPKGADNHAGKSWGWCAECEAGERIANKAWSYASRPKCGRCGTYLVKWWGKAPPETNHRPIERRPAKIETLEFD